MSEQEQDVKPATAEKPEPKVEPKAKAKAAPKLKRVYNRRNEDAILGEGEEAIMIPPRGQVVVSEENLPEELPAGVIATDFAG